CHRLWSQNSASANHQKNTPVAMAKGLRSSTKPGRVSLTAGPLAGLRGLFEAETGDQRAMVLLEILNRQHRVQLPLRDLRRA
ncbi:MAG: hypothetical protein ACPGJE_10285, partial [Wenzhouxiangellaceae bacterium]